MAHQAQGASPPAQLNLIANPMDAAASSGLPAGNFIITGGMYGSGQERILVHTGGLPSAPPSVSAPTGCTAAPQQLSPVFILPPTSPQVTPFLASTIFLAFKGP